MPMVSMNTQPFANNGAKASITLIPSRFAHYTATKPQQKFSHRSKNLVHIHQPLSKLNTPSTIQNKANTMERICPDIRAAQAHAYLPPASNVFSPRIPPLPQQNLSSSRQTIPKQLTSA
ncbi:CPS_collapsed_G0016840.mRNA.1.CDS.1 [Saccharomyces cerevisiae]|nr:CPS_collapsed_G0016840.mRNA.1.CDS.1 [Saccharomyces cerevisiae]